MASIDSVQDLKESLNIEYNGTFDNLLWSRYGVEATSSIYADLIKLPMQRDEIFKMIASSDGLIEKILTKSLEERSAYLTYVDKLNLQAYRNVAVVDIGFAGTIQKYLQKILKRELFGLYMVTIDQMRSNNFKASALFCEGIDRVMSTCLIYKESQILESIMTVPFGQLVRFVDSGGLNTPEFLPHVADKDSIETIEKIWDEVSQYIDDAISLIGDLPLPSTYASTYFFDVMARNKEDIISGDLKKIFVVDDLYVSGSILEPFRY